MDISVFSSLPNLLWSSSLPGVEKASRCFLSSTSTDRGMAGGPPRMSWHQRVLQVEWQGKPRVTMVRALTAALALWHLAHWCEQFCLATHIERMLGIVGTRFLYFFLLLIIFSFPFNFFLWRWCLRRLMSHLKNVDTVFPSKHPFLNLFELWITDICAHTKLDHLKINK